MQFNTFDNNLYSMYIGEITYSWFITSFLLHLSEWISMNSASLSLKESIIHIKKLIF